MLKRFFREEEGATMVEYGLMIALIAVVLIVTVALLGTSLKESFANVNAGVEHANTADTGAGTPTATFP
jgi:pilus assembly protein Flp/PilA